MVHIHNIKFFSGKNNRKFDFFFNPNISNLKMILRIEFELFSSDSFSQVHDITLCDGNIKRLLRFLDKRFSGRNEHFREKKNNTNKSKYGAAYFKSISVASVFSVEI